MLILAFGGPKLDKARQQCTRQQSAQWPSTLLAADVVFLNGSQLIDFFTKIFFIKIFLAKILIVKILLLKFFLVKFFSLKFFLAKIFSLKSFLLNFLVKIVSG